MTGVPAAGWPETAQRIQSRIVRPPKVNSQMAVLGQTGAGKDHLVRWGILPAFPLARVVLLVTKHGKEATWDGWGNPVSPGQLRPGFGRGKDGTPRYRVNLIPGQVSEEEARDFLKALAAEGEMIVVIGDTARLTDPKRMGGLNCEGEVNHMMGEGREIGLTVIACANATAWTAAGVKGQAAAIWIGKSGPDEQGPFADIAGLPKRNVQQGRGAERDALARLPAHSWLYTDHADGPLFARITTPPGAGSSDESWPE